MTLDPSTLPTFAEPGYAVEAWGDPQPDWTDAGDGFAWYDGDVYHVGPPPGWRAGQVTEPEWRYWLVPEDRPESPDDPKATTCRWRVTHARTEGKYQAIRDPTARERRQMQTNSRSKLNANQALAREERRVAVQSAISSLGPPPEVTAETPVYVVADYTVRAMSIVAMSPDTELPEKKLATEIAKNWASIGHQSRLLQAVRTSAEAGDQPKVSPALAAKMAELRDTLALNGLQDMAAGR